MLKKIIATVVLLSMTLSFAVYSQSQDVYIDFEDFSGTEIGENWEVTCAEGNIAKINTDNRNYELNKYIDNSGVRLSYVIPQAISTGKLAIEFSFYMNGTDGKAVQIKGINEKGTDIFLYMLTQGKRAGIRNEVSGYTDLSTDLLTKGQKHTLKTVIDFDAEKENISTWINSEEASAKKGFQQAATTVNLKKISFYIPTVNEYTGGGIVIDDFKINTVSKCNIDNEKLNTGFENVTEITPGTNNWLGDKRPLVWGNPNKVDTPAGVSFTAMIDEEVAHSGSYSLKLGSDTEPARVMVSQTVNGLEPDKTYRLSGYVKTAGYESAAISSPGPVIRAMVANSSNYYYTTSVESTTDWTYVENIFSPGATSIRIDCNFATGCGFAWFDDIKLEEYIPVRSVTLSRQNIEMDAGDKYQLSAGLYPVSGRDTPIEWSSSDEDIATVDENGIVTAVGIKSGRAVVSATVTENICFPSSGGKKVVSEMIEGVCIVKVENPIYDTKVALINLDKTSLTLHMGDFGEEITASVKPMSAVNRVVTWRSSDNSIVTVTDGMVIPKAPGVATVYAEADGVAAECVVTVKADAGAPVLNYKTYEPSESFDIAVTATDYPKLLFDMSDIERIRDTAKHPLYEKSYLTMAGTAEKYLGKSYVTHPVTASGGRVLNKRVCELAMIGYINRDMRYINKAVAYMMNSSDKYTASDYKNMNGDIALGDAAHAYAVGYDWLYPFMTEQQRIQIEDEMHALIDELYKILNTKSAAEIPAVSSNHASVSAGGMGLAALVLGNRPEALELAEKITVEYYKTSKDPEGFSFEGISYYCYGLLGAATFNAALERIKGTDMLKQVPSYKNTLDAITYYTNPDGKGYAAIGDSSGNVSPGGGIIYLISKYKNATALWNYLRLTGDDGDRSYGGGDDYLGASIPYMLIFADTDIVPQKPDSLPHAKEYKSGFVSMRDGWEDESSFVTFTSSAVPHRGHNQRDENSFTFNAFGERFLIDPGYTPTETSSHNAVLVNGSGQSVPGDKYDIYGSVEGCAVYDEIGYVKGDASTTYPSQPDISAVLREILYRGGSNPYIVVRDNIKMPENVNANIQVLFQTDIKNKVVLNKDADEIRIIGAKNGAVMEITNPFDENTINRCGSYDGRSITGGRGEYVVSDYSKTVEAITNTKGNAHIVSLIIASQTSVGFPEIEVSGTSENGVIKLKFPEGRIDYITLTENDIKARSVKTQWKNDGDSIYADVKIGPSVNESESLFEIYSVKHDGERLMDVKIKEFILSGEGSDHKLPFGAFEGEKSLFFWKKGDMTPVFDRAYFEK